MDVTKYLRKQLWEEGFILTQGFSPWSTGSVAFRPWRKKKKKATGLTLLNRASLCAELLLVPTQYHPWTSPLMVILWSGLQL
jgi:hypothetical protein